jgi:hypothetical protein
MGTQEIYIRNANDTEARGPFQAAQVADLAEAGQVTAATLIYDATTEQWVELNTNAELMAVVFPPKKKLAFKAKEIASLNVKEDTAKPISVDDMLAAAEGRTADTKGKQRLRWRAPPAASTSAPRAENIPMRAARSCPAPPR